MNLFILIYSGLSAQTLSEITDLRDGRVYKTVSYNIKHSKDSISQVIWMAENLNFAHEKSSCFNGAQSNCEGYGRLYTFSAAMQSCPAGWQLPTNSQWTQLIDHFGGLSKAAKKLKSQSDFWTGSKPELEGIYLGSRRYAGNDKSLFSILPTGVGTPETGHFKFGLSAVFWSSTSKTESMAWDWIFSASTSAIINSDGDKRTTGNSVRCIK